MVIKKTNYEIVEEYLKNTFSDIDIKIGHKKREINTLSDELRQLKRSKSALYAGLNALRNKEK